MGYGQWFMFLVLLTSGISWSIAREPPKSGGFTVLQRTGVADSPGLEIVMGLLERNQKSTSSKHYHPGGEFGYVIEGAVTIETETHGAVTLQAGSSFQQAPGEWHIVSTATEGAKTVLFRVVTKGEPMVVEID